MSGFFQDLSQGPEPEPERAPVPAAGLAALPMELLLAGLRDGITVQDRTGRLVYANRAAARLIGFESPDMLLGTPVRELMERFEALDEKGAPLPLDELPGRRALAGEEDPEKLICYRIRATGEERWSVVKASAIRDAGGEVRWVVNLLHDITERIRHERLLAEQRTRLEIAAERSRFLAEASRMLGSSLEYENTLAAVARLAVPLVADWCVVHLADDGGRVERLELAHADPERLELAKRVSERYPPDPEASRGVHRVIRTGVPELHPDISDEDLEAFARDSEHLELLRSLGLRSAMLVPLVAGDRVLGAVSFICGDSGRRYGEEDLTVAMNLASRGGLAIEHARLYAEVRSANRAKSDFLSIVSHELRTPLNVVVGYIELMLAGVPEPLPAAARRHAERIRAASGQLVRVIEEILSFARVDAGVDEVRPDEVELGGLLGEIADLTGALAAGRSLRFRYRPLDHAVLLRTDPGKVMQILLNLISNAVRFTVRGEIELSAVVEPGAIAISVRDTGPGIRPEDLERIFEPFRQVEDPRTRRTGGAGLGLSVSRSLARRIGGDIVAASVPGRGSTFTLRLPHARGREGPASAAAAAS